MIELIDAARNIGREVEYRPREGASERGVISAISPAGWVFVRYGADAHAKATNPGDLFLTKTDDGAAAPPADLPGASTPAAAERAMPTVAPSSPKPLQGRGGEGDAAQRLGLVIAEGNQVGEQGLGTCSPEPPPCKYCGEIAGHTGQCVVIS